jgi:HSP20 family protein
MNTREIVTQKGQSDALAGTMPVYPRVPAADIYETGDAFLVMLDLPGARKETVSLTLEEGELRVKAEQDTSDPEKGTLLFGDVPSGPYTRVFTLGEGIDLANVDARFESGVLTVKLFKNEERKPREIAIH